MAYTRLLKTVILATFFFCGGCSDADSGAVQSPAEEVGPSDAGGEMDAMASDIAEDPRDLDVTDKRDADVEEEAPANDSGFVEDTDANGPLEDAAPDPTPDTDNMDANLDDTGAEMDTSADTDEQDVAVDTGPDSEDEPIDIETEVFLEFGAFDPQDSTLEIIMTNTQAVAGLQFRIDGIAIDGAGAGGTAEAAGMMVQSGRPCQGMEPCARVLAFSLDLSAVDPGRGIFTILNADTTDNQDEACFSDIEMIVASDRNAMALTNSHGPCISLTE